MTKALIVEADFYAHITRPLRDGAVAVLEKEGVGYDVISVPGALEIPAALLFSVEGGQRDYDCFIALGCVIRGETSHYDIVCHESARGIYNLVFQYSLALGNGVLTVENEAQAFERADPRKKDKGGEAARAALHMLALKKRARLDSDQA